MALLDIRNLSVEFQTTQGPFRAVDGVDLTLEKGAVLGIVGESGSGKSVTVLALMGLLPWTAKVTADRLDFDGRDLLGLAPAERRRLVGKDMAMIFQEPMTSLNPCFTVGFQIMESPQIAATVAFQAHTATGKLNAVMIPTVPSGCQVSRIECWGRSDWIVNP